MDTYTDFTQVNSIIQRIPGTLLVIGPPGLLKDLIHTLAFLPLQPITTGDPRRPWDSVGSRVSISARGACRTLQAAAKLGKKKKKDKRWVLTLKRSVGGFHLRPINKIGVETDFVEPG